SRTRRAGRGRARRPAATAGRRRPRRASAAAAFPAACAVPRWRRGGGPVASVAAGPGRARPARDHPCRRMSSGRTAGTGPASALPCPHAAARPRPARRLSMIRVHYWPTPNGHKITLFLEEAGLPYELVPVDIGRGAQFEPDFLAISPNNKMPAIVDDEPADGGAPLSVFESGAILLYLADKTGRFLPRDLRGRGACLEWLCWQVAGLGPMLGQNHHFNVYAPERIPYAIGRYTRESERLYCVLDRRLAGRRYICGDDYS